MEKLKISKFGLNFKLPMILWIIFMLIVLIEGFGLFLGLKIGFGSSGRQPVETAAEVSKVDLPAYEETLEWVEDRENYILPDYELQSPELGRENPFLE